MSDFTGRSLLTSLDFTSAELCELVDLALAIKSGRHRPDLAGRVGTFLYFNPSLRTRVSCQAALARFGGQGITLQPGSETWAFELADGAVMDGDSQEHVRELAPVLARYSDFLGVRRVELATRGSEGARATASYAELAADVFLHRLAALADVPVINLESNRFHPLQGLADMATLTERLGEPRGRKYVLTWAWHPKALPAATPHSQLLAAADLGMQVVCLRPPGFGLEPAVIAAARARAEAGGGSLIETEDRVLALRGARVLCAKAWGALDLYGRPEEEARVKEPLRARWIVREDDLARTDDAFFMHCLPVRRNVVASDGVLDSPRSAVLDEAENRLWTAAAVFEAVKAPQRRHAGC
jgi:N-acetylornithine carbamoyltransferase